ncbi:MAG: hypothetical protein AAGB07_16835, partial [Pseudomonadota bacterium]
MLTFAASFAWLRPPKKPHNLHKTVNIANSRIELYNYVSIQQKGNNRTPRTLTARGSIMLDANTIKDEQNNKFITDSDIESFAINGFVVKRGALDADLMKDADDLMWDALGGHFVPDDPSTWRGVAKDCLGALPISDRYGKVKLRDEIWEHPALNNL